jgi:hypothetical protein
MQMRAYPGNREVLLYDTKVKEKVTEIKKDRDNMPVPQK